VLFDERGRRRGLRGTTPLGSTDASQDRFYDFFAQDKPTGEYLDGRFTETIAACLGDTLHEAFGA